MAYLVAKMQRCRCYQHEIYLHIQTYDETC